MYSSYDYERLAEFIQQEHAAQLRHRQQLREASGQKQAPATWLAFVSSLFALL